MFDNLTGLGWGLVSFAIVVGVGTLVVYNFAGNVGCSGSAVQGSFNATSGTCQNATGQPTPSGTAYTNLNYLNGQLGQSGLAGWTPAIIAISVGVLLLGTFLVGRGGRKGRY